MGDEVEVGVGVEVRMVVGIEVAIVVVVVEEQEHIAGPRLTCTGGVRVVVRDVQQ